MQKRILVAFFILFFLCGCTSREKEELDNNAVVSLQESDKAADGEKDVSNEMSMEYPFPKEIEKLEKLDLIAMGLYADEKQSIQNSNQLNSGYFTADEDGNIYFSDYTQNAIYACGAEGANKELVYEGIGAYLHIANGYLYFVDIDTEKKYAGKIVKINLKTKEVVILYEEPCGEITIMQDTLYNNISGMAGMKLDEPDKGFTRLSEIESVFLNSDGRYLFYNMVTGEPSFLFERGYLLAWDTETETNYFVESKMIFPLLAGNWLSYIDLQTNARHVLDIETGADTDLTGYIQRAASDGHKLYWAQQEIGSFQIMQWDGKEIQELLKVEGEADKYGDVFL